MVDLFKIVYILADSHSTEYTFGNAFLVAYNATQLWERCSAISVDTACTHSEGIIQNLYTRHPESQF